MVWKQKDDGLMNSLRQDALRPHFNKVSLLLRVCFSKETICGSK